jgi:hypothetical protein
VSYDPEAGLLKSLKRGTCYGHRDRDGYIVFKIAGRDVFAHRVAVLLMTGEWPAAVVDHINGDRADNRWENLRAVTQRVNRQNMRAAHKDSRSGLLGVSPYRGRFRAQLYAGGKNSMLGTFGTAQEAHEAYVAAKREQHPGCRL